MNSGKGWKIAGVIVSLLSLALPIVGEVIQDRQWENDKNELRKEIECEIREFLMNSKET